MTNILRIDSSSRPVGQVTDGASFTRAIADEVVHQLVTANPDAHLVARDLIADPIPHVSAQTITGYYTDAAAMTQELSEATALSDRLIEEVESADHIVISAPIYNFSVPSVLKAWIDQIVRGGRTFACEDSQFRGLVADRPVSLILGYGASGYGEGGPLEAYDYLRPYLVHVLNFIGLTSVNVIAVENTTGPDATANLAKAKASVASRFTQMAAQ
ncbi:FMN-dependent NADH-azoreductase [Ruegeria arenilitoris]|uniref:FMN-dependent NADH-azoreductase n=1 Tax=Ruegeria arenilitoris TaxID=1173585 RepID=UPI00147F5C41|nr:NAD(P)H-dependent oxidoreductase [Ruegeria arenilitoris]